jgi:hypothetical protein
MERNSKNLSLALLTLSMTLFSLIVIRISPVWGAQTRLYIVPPSIVDASKGPGTLFSVNATLQNVTNLWNWQVNVTFNPSIINCTDAWIPPESPFAFPLQPGAVIDDVAGWVMLGASKLGATPGVNGSGVLAVIDFQVLSRGVSAINFSKPYGPVTFLKDNKMALITPVTVEDGLFNNWIAPPPAKLYINPPSVVDPALTPGNQFDVNVSVINATSLYTWELKVAYNNSIVTGINVVEGEFLKSGGTTVFMYDILNNFNATHGLINMNCTLGSGLGVTGNGVLATITFHVEDLGGTPITISDDVLLDSMSNILPHHTFNGYFNNILMAKLSVEPAEIIGPQYVPCTTFDINITLNDAENLMACQLNLTYNSVPLNFIGISFYKVNNQTASAKIIQDQDAGFVWIKLTYPNPVTTHTPVPLVKIEFHVEALGTSPLNLNDTSLTDPIGKPIAHDVYNGYFASIIADVGVTGIKITTYGDQYIIPYRGWCVYINVTVENDGNMNQTFDVKTYYNDTHLIGIISVVDLPPNQNTTITFVWNTSTVAACNHYTISAEATPVPYETNLANNYLTDGSVKVRYPGDVNNDGTVTMDDIGLIALAYGKAPGHEGWNPEADINQDGVVDLTDLGLAAINFGKGCT